MEYKQNCCFQTFINCIQNKIDSDADVRGIEFQIIKLIEFAAECNIEQKNKDELEIINKK